MQSVAGQSTQPMVDSTQPNPSGPDPDLTGHWHQRDEMTDDQPPNQRGEHHESRSALLAWAFYDWASNTVVFFVLGFAMTLTLPKADTRRNSNGGTDERA